MPEAVEQDLDQLIRYTVGFCAELLEKYGETFPVGAYIDVSRQLVPVNVVEGDEQPDSEEMIDRFKSLFGRLISEGHAMAWAVCWDAEVTSDTYPEGTDALVLTTHHTRSEQQIEYTFPYTLNSGAAEFGEEWWGNYYE